MTAAGTDLAGYARALARRIATGTVDSGVDFGAAALALFRLQYAANAAYRRLCEGEGGTPGRVTDWRLIPAAPTVAFKELELTTLTPADRVGEFRSSGTTGQRPSRHHHSALSLAVYEASAWAWFRPHLLPEAGDGRAGVCRLLALTPPPEEARHSSLVHMLSVVGREGLPGGTTFLGRLGADGVWEIDFDRVGETLREAERSREPVVVLGTAFGFVHLADHLEGCGRSFHLAPGSRAMETGGYKGRSRELSRDALHAAMGARLGIPRERIVCEYGMCELGSQAYDRVWNGSEPRRFRFPPWARALVLSAETGRPVDEGETGLLRVVDLANVASVLAIQTEDLVVRRGDGFELIGRAARAEPRGCSLMAPADAGVSGGFPRGAPPPVSAVDPAAARAPAPGGG